MGEVVVGDGNGSGAHNGVDESVRATGEGVMVDPYVAWTKDGDAIPVSERSPPVVGGGAANHGVASLLAVVNVEAVDDDVGDELDGDARAVGDVDVGAAPVDGLEAVHYQLLLQRDDHVPLEHDPQGTVLDHGVSERSRFRVHWVVVVRVRHHVVAAVAPADCVAAEADAAVGELLSPEVPPLVAPPAVIDWVPRPTWEEIQISSSRRIADAPVFESYIN